MELKDWERYFVRRLYFYETVITPFESEDLYEFLTSDFNLDQEYEFSAWLEEQELQEDFKKWLKDRNYEEEFDNVYAPTERTEEQIERDSKKW